MVNISFYSNSLEYYLNCEVTNGKISSLHISASPMYTVGSDPWMEKIEEFLSTGKGNLLDIPILPEGTDFQLKVWNALRNIPPGQVKTYSSIATEIGKPAAARAVGNAVASNPIVLLIPCHRVVARNGMGGFSAEGGVETKLRILDLEHFRPLENR